MVILTALLILLTTVGTGVAQYPSEPVTNADGVTPAGAITAPNSPVRKLRGQDPLAVADALGRPVAILRLGGRLPDHQTGPDEHFLYGSPPVVKYPRRAAAAAVNAPVPSPPVAEDR